MLSDLVADHAFVLLLVFLIDLVRDDGDLLLLVQRAEVASAWLIIGEKADDQGEEVDPALGGKVGADHP